MSPAVSGSASHRAGVVTGRRSLPHTREPGVGGVQIIGHRGHMRATGVTENSAAAVAAGLAAGADAVEVDVRLTADGVPVCVHDPDLGRLAGMPVEVAGVTHRELDDALSACGARVDRLVDVADAARGRGGLIVEVKHEGCGRPSNLVSTVVKTLAAAHPDDELVISSFSGAVLSEVRRQFPGMRRALVTPAGSTALAGLNEVLAWGHHELHAHLRSVMVQPRVVDLARSEGRVLRCWDVQRLVDARLLEAAGVSGVIVDDPGAMSRGLAGVRVPVVTGSAR
jgi:glycerophosphoryl diester phosphodiesterase